MTTEPAALPFRKDLLAGQAAIVTGGGTGIGRGIAMALAEVGAKVALASRKLENLEAVAAEITAAGGTAVAIQCDVRDPASVEAMVAEAERLLGPISILINNAGATFTVDAEKLSPNGFRAVMEIDTFGTFYCSQSFGKRVIERGTGGSIVNITGNQPSAGNPGRIHGGAGKAGVESMTKTLAVEWGPYQIRVNSLAPGTVPTHGADAGVQAEDATDAQRATSVPLGRLGTPRDIALAAVFLVSDAASYITGATLMVDGARSLFRGRED